MDNKNLKKPSVKCQKRMEAKAFKKARKELLKHKKEEQIKAAKKKKALGWTTYHLFPMNHARCWWLKRMGEEKPVKVFRDYSKAQKYINTHILIRDDVKVIFHNEKGKVI